MASCIDFLISSADFAALSVRLWALSAALAVRLGGVGAICGVTEDGVGAAGEAGGLEKETTSPEAFLMMIAALFLGGMV
jgi:hypothetical protein